MVSIDYWLGLPANEAGMFQTATMPPRRIYRMGPAGFAVESIGQIRAQFPHTRAQLSSLVGESVLGVIFGRILVMSRYR
jgi:hypothetical protein